MSAALPIATGRRTFATGWRLLRRRPAALATVIAVLLIGSVCGLVGPWALGRLVDLIGQGRATAVIVWELGGLILGAAIVAALTTGLGIVLAARLFETALAELREDFVERALALPQGEVERAGTGDLVSRASDDVAQISDAIPQIVPALTSAFFTIVVTLAGMAVIDGRLALALLVAVPVYALTVRWYLRTAPGLYAAERAAIATRAHHVLASLRGLDTVLAFRLSDRHASRIATASWQVVRWGLLTRTVQNMFFGRLNLAEFVGMSSLLVVGYALVQQGAATIGGATTAVLLLLVIFEPIGELMLVIDDAQSAAASLSRLVGILRADGRESDAAAPDGAGPDEPDAAAGDAVAVVERVSFAYQDGHPVLHEVSLRIARGERVALVGASGAGKTTIAALIAGIHHPTSGALSRPDRTLLLAQETHVFTGTLAENLTLARVDADDDELHAALATAQAREFVAQLPDGLGTPLGHDGHPLSAAEEQQIALARLVLADPELAVLDEATAEADSADSGVLDRAAAAAIDGRAALVVAHRLSQAAACDRILVIDDGRVIEEGDHDSLVAACGVYAGLWSAWSSGRSA